MERSREGEVKIYQPSALGSSGQRKFKRKVRIKKNLRQKAMPKPTSAQRVRLLIPNVLTANQLKHKTEL